MSVGGASGLALLPRPAARPSVNGNIERLLPKRIGERRAVEASGVILPPPDELELGIYDQIVARRYGYGDRSPITVLIAYGPAQSYANQLHRPELCYPASGFRIMREGLVDLPLREKTLPAKYVEAARGDRRDAILYWTKIGSDYPRSLWQQRLTVAKTAFDRRTRDGILVRLSQRAESHPDDRADLEEFARALFEHLGPAARDLFFGQLI